MNKQSEKLKVKGEKYKICATDFEGITLVALVITIIVLIILAGVSINAVMNQGLITNAKDAKSEFEYEKEKENKKLQSAELEIHFSTTGKKMKAANGYVTNVAGMTDADLPKGYTRDGIEIKNEKGEVISKIIEYGEVDGVAGITSDDALEIQKILESSSYMNEILETGKEYKIIAADADNNGIVNEDDAEYIGDYIAGKVTIEQDRYALHIDDVIIETEAMRVQKEIDKAIAGFPTNYKKVYNEEFMCYEVKIDEDSLTIEQLKNMFSGKVVDVYEITDLVEYNMELRETGNIGNNYVLFLDELFCLWFKI